MESLKVAIVSDWFYPKIGGIEAHMDELARNLLNFGHEPVIITHDYRYLKPYRDEFPYKVVRFPSPIYIKKAHISLSPNQLWKINKFYKREAFDVTHVHSLYSPLGIAVANLSRGIRNVPVIATNHSFYGKPRMDWALRRTLKKTLWRVDSFIAVSRAIEKDTQELLGESLANRPIFLVPNGVDTSFWRPPEPEERSRVRKSLGLDENDFVLLYVGRMTRRKRAHVLPLIVGEILKKLPENIAKRVKLLMVGEGPMKPVLFQRLSKVGIGDRTLLFKFMSRPKLRRIYWAADVALVPSELEAFSIVSLEALSTGVPVIGMNDSGLSDLIISGKNGFLVGSDEEMVTVLVELLLGDVPLKKLSKSARDRVESFFSWKVVINRILGIYRRTIESATEDKRYTLYKAWRRFKG